MQFAQQTSDNFVLTSFVSAAFPTTAVPTAAPTDCAYVSSALSYCNSLDPGISTQGPTLQAACLCYTSGSWIPENFDGAVDTCADFLFTANPGLYSTFTGLEGFCFSVGNFSASTSSSTSFATSTFASAASSAAPTGAQPTTFNPATSNPAATATTGPTGSAGASPISGGSPQFHKKNPKS